MVVTFRLLKGGTTAADTTHRRKAWIGASYTDEELARFMVGELACDNDLMDGREGDTHS